MNQRASAAAASRPRRSSTAAASSRPASPPAPSPSAPALHGVNLCVVRGRVARPATERILPDERSSWSFEVRIAAMPSCPGTSVPVVWEPANRGGEPVTAGEEVVVVGAVRQRFFRAGGATQSRTEVLASSIVAANRRAGARRALERVVAALDG